jgi:hypothetical protein
MAYFVFGKNLDNINNTIYRIAENESDLNNLNIMQSDYKIIEDSQSNFNLVKFMNKFPEKYVSNTITYIDQIPTIAFPSKKELQEYVNNIKENIKQFTNNNPNHSLFDRWNNYYSQLNTLNLDTISYPLNKSLEQYFNDLAQTSLSPLQIP